MDQPRQSMRMIFVLLVSAVACGIATFLVIVLFVNRSSEPSSSVAGTPVDDVTSNSSLSLASDHRGWGLLGSVPDTEIETVSTSVTVKGNDALVAGTTIASLPKATALLSEIILVDYRILPGDTLYSISLRQNTSIDLMAVYGISSGDLVEGSIISIPIVNPAFCPAMVPYLVRDGDTVFSIAQRFNSTTEAIASVNYLDNAFTIRTAEVLCIP